MPWIPAVFLAFTALTLGLLLRVAFTPRPGNLERLFISAVLAIPIRLPLLFIHDGHCDAEASREIVRAWLSGAPYAQRWPGSPVYDVILGSLDRLAGAIHLPWFVLTNAFSACCVMLTLYFLLLILEPALGFRRSLLAALAFNFYPQELVIGAATYELNLLLPFLAGGFYSLLLQRRRLALLLMAAGFGAKFLGFALLGPAALIALGQRGQRDTALVTGALMLALSLLFLLPHWQAGRLDFLIGPLVGKTLYHAEIGAGDRFGAFLLRTGNFLGPLGLPIMTLVLFRSKEFFSRLKTATGVLLGAFSLLLLGVMFKGPWETYYLLPLVPLCIFLVLQFSRSSALIGLFLFSLWLPNLIQIQIRPWKFPPWVVRDGVVKAHFERNWVVRGGG